MKKEFEKSSQIHTCGTWEIVQSASRILDFSKRYISAG